MAASSIGPSFRCDPPHGRGAMLPRSRRHCLNPRTHDRATPNVSATSLVGDPRSHAAITFPRKSIEYVIPGSFHNVLMTQLTEPNSKHQMALRTCERCSSDAGLGAIFDDFELVLPRHLHDRAHVGHAAHDAGRRQRDGARGDAFFGQKVSLM